MKTVKVKRGMTVDSMVFDQAIVGLRNSGVDRMIEFTFVAEGHSLAARLDADEARTLSEALKAIAKPHEDQRPRVTADQISFTAHDS